MPGNVPKKVEEIAKALISKGYDESAAYAIAWSEYKANLKRSAMRRIFKEFVDQK